MQKTIFAHHKSQQPGAKSQGLKHTLISPDQNPHMSDITSPEYWNQRYLKDNTPWDIGYASPPITEFFKGGITTDTRVLIPGAGNAHEAGWLWENGYTNVWVADIAEQPLRNLQAKYPSFPAAQLLHTDFFNLEDQFDLIVEQTFFCALPPDWRKKYVQQMKSLLKPGGQLVGLLFDFPLTEEGPPFGGSHQEYKDLFTDHFEIIKMERSFNSIKPRQDREIFINLRVDN